MDRKKIFLIGMIIGTIAFALLFGCLAQNQPLQGKGDIALELNQTAIVPDKGLISTDNDGKLSVVTIRAQNTSNGRWQFPLSNYEDEFEGAGLYSDSFVRLNRSHIKWLDSGEAIWLTPMIRSGNSTVLFNAVYSNDIANRSDVANCSEGTVRILGKTYSLAQLQNSSSFEHDDKWRVRVEVGDIVPANMTKEQQIQYDLSSYREFCPKRIVIFLDGYFSDLKEGDQIPLFRNDNTVLFAFGRIDGVPQARVIAASPASDTTSYEEAGEIAALDIEGNWTISSAASEPHEERLTINDEGARIEFEPALEAAALDQNQTSGWYAGTGIYTYSLDADGKAYERFGKQGWGLAWFDINGSEFLGLNRVASSWQGPCFDAMDNASDFSEGTDSVLIGGKRYAVGTPSFDGSDEARFCLVEKRTDDSFDFCGGSYDLELPNDAYSELDGEYYYVHSGYSYAGQPFAYVIRYEIAGVYPGVDGVMVDWSGTGPPEGGLSAISASRQSQIFEKLTG